MAVSYELFVKRMAWGFDEALGITGSALGIGGEAWEILDLIKKQTYHIKDGQQPLSDLEFRERLGEEIGDCLFYLTYLAFDYLGRDLESIKSQNRAKLAARYPDRVPS